MNSKKKNLWWKKLDPADIRAAFEEAVTDAYGDDEQHTGLLTQIENDLEFPFRAKVMGMELEIVDMEWPSDDAHGLDLICLREGKRHPVEARSVELLPSFPDGHLSLAAYLDWKSRF